MSSFHILLPGAVIRPLTRALDKLQDLGLLIVRVWISKIFFKSALTKLAYWPGTIVLFKYQYTVPFLSPSVSAHLGTAIELIIPIFVAIGLGGRLAIFIFFVFNIICVLSFHFLWTPAGAAGFSDHVMWGLLLMMLLLFGMGRFSIDYLIHRRFGYFIELGTWDEVLHQFNREKKIKSLNEK